ncbi:MAG: PEGA domain-containing protein [Acidobacteria bacterium]|nr:PEGA domain-containing protein [Acidobacteriota bacterium]
MRSVPEERRPLTPDDPAAFAPPPAFGPFRVLHQIGVGALGPVFRTYEPTRDRLVAVKVFRLDVTPEQAQVLADELSRAPDASLFHPSIVEPIAAGIQGTVAYRAEEYVAAESLDIAMRHYAPAAIDVALPFITQLANAIDFARAAGVGHGALHPRDVFITPDEARATGFGVVEALERVGLRAPVRRPYSPPERIAGAAWGTTADVFSLAAITYELLTGRRPAGTGSQIGPLTGSKLGGHADAVGAVLSKAMAEDPADRYQAALTFATALWAAAGGAHMPVQPAAAQPVQPVAAEPDTRGLAREFKDSTDLDDIDWERDSDAVHHELSRAEQEADTSLYEEDSDEAEADRLISGAAALSAGFNLADDLATKAHPSPSQDHPIGDELGDRLVVDGLIEEYPPESLSDEVPSSAPSVRDEFLLGLSPNAERATADEPELIGSDLQGSAADDDLMIDPTPPASTSRDFLLIPADPGPSATQEKPDLWKPASREEEPIRVDPRKSASREEAPIGLDPRDDLLIGANPRAEGLMDADPSAAPLREEPWTPAAPAAESRVPVVPLVLALIVGLLGGFLGGYAIFKSRGAQGAPSTIAGQETPPPGDGKAYSEQAVGPPAPTPARPAESAPSAAPTAPRPPTRGQITVRSTPAGAGVTVNGRWRGRTPLTLKELPFANYSVRVVRPGFATSTSQVALSAQDASRTLSLRLQRAAAAAPAPARGAARGAAPAPSAPLTGSLYVDSRPRGARVLLDGREIGTTPVRVADVRIGSHVVRLELADHSVWTTSTRIVAGADNRVSGSLERIR